MIRLRPHTLQYCSRSHGYRDAEGFFHQGEERWSGRTPCHARPAGAADVIKYPDGTTERYRYNVYLDLIKDIIRVGDRVRLTLSDGSSEEYRVLGAFYYQTHIKLWL